MPILWNVSKKQSLATKFNGDEFTWKPEEKKKVYIPDVIKHLLYKLAPKGLVLVPDDLNDDAQLQSLHVAGLKRRKAMLKDVVTQYVNANNERKAQRLGTVEPTQYEADCVREIKEIEKEIAAAESISKEDSDLVNSYLQENNMTQEQVESSRETITQGKSGQIEGPDEVIEDDEEAPEAQAPVKTGKARAVSANRSR